MLAFFTGLPTWMLVGAGLLLAYLLYRYWQHKKATAYAPSIVRGKDVDFSSPRDNPIYAEKKK